MTGTRARPPIVLLTFLVLFACTEPPSREIAAAEKALGDARQQEAERYAPERWKEAQSALSQAHRKVEERDYRSALSSATDAFDKSRLAAQAAAEAKAAARGEAAAAQAEIRTSLNQATRFREEARRARVPDAAFTALDPLLGEIRASLASVTEALERGDALAARDAAAEVKSEASGLPGLVRQARLRWEADHARGRGRGRPARPRPPQASPSSGPT